MALGSEGNATGSGSRFLSFWFAPAPEEWCLALAAVEAVVSLS